MFQPIALLSIYLVGVSERTEWWDTADPADKTEQQTRCRLGHGLSVTDRRRTTSEQLTIRHRHVADVFSADCSRRRWERRQPRSRQHRATDAGVQQSCHFTSKLRTVDLHTSNMTVIHSQVCFGKANSECTSAEMIDQCWSRFDSVVLLYLTRGGGVRD